MGIFFLSADSMLGRITFTGAQVISLYIDPFPALLRLYERAWR